MRPYITVIITTYNREKQLAKCLDKIKNQTLTADAYEVIVVNDGSTDQTEKFLDEQSGIKVFHQENAGQGNARNLAIPHAQGQVILFIGDDIYAPESFLETHVNFHKENPNLEDACLGLTLWDQDLKQNPFMQWLTDGGPQFAYHKLKPGEEASFWFFYTSNISLKAELLHKQPFDPDFKGYGWEDTELAYRMQKEEGLRITYTPAALAYHDHYMEEDSLKNKMKKIGANANIFQMKHPELKVAPKGFKKIALHLIASLPSLFLLSILRILIPASGRRLYWYALSKRYFLQGLRSV
jgi:glycosyltransferase involved in cell wall biosynthesis